MFTGLTRGVRLTAGGTSTAGIVAAGGVADTDHKSLASGTFIDEIKINGPVILQEILQSRVYIRFNAVRFERFQTFR